MTQDNKEQLPQEAENAFVNKHLAIIKAKLKERGIEMPLSAKDVAGKVMDDFRYFIHRDHDEAFELCKQAYLDKIPDTLLSHFDKKEVASKAWKAAMDRVAYELLGSPEDAEEPPLKETYLQNI